MDIDKSSRHSKIVGDFGEVLILYWLSKYGFECACVDQVGIDLIARNPHTKELMGISVKSRTRNLGKENVDVRITSDTFDKIACACKAFGCVPYFAIVIDADDIIRAFLLPMQHLRKLCGAPTGANWKMSEKAISQYATDPQIKTFELKTSSLSWWNPSGSEQSSLLYSSHSPLNRPGASSV